MRVEEYVAAEAQKPFAWGETDCCSTADRWLRNVHGGSPIGMFDDWDRSRAQALECISHPYALPARVNRAMRKAGFKRTTQPVAGDIALVRFDGRLCVSIHAGTFWFSRHEDGLVGAPLGNFWKAWAI